MKCPKCQYLSFDSPDRCRNCGYEFSLSVDAAELDLPLKTGDEPAGPLADLSLADVDGLSESPRHQKPIAPQEPAGYPDRRPVASAELPLFRDRMAADDAPLVSVPAMPRAPVAVRKSSPAVRPQAPRRDPEEPELDLEPPQSAARRVGARPQQAVREHAAAAVESDVLPATAGARLLAGLIDAALVLGIDAAVLFLTLKVAGLELSETGVMPVIPFVAFLLLLNGGYMAGFTAAGGQSIGKMAARIKVVSAEPEAWTERVPIGQAVLRFVGYVVSALPVGLGFVPAFFGTERRALHDRLAHTRVVKA